MRAEVLGSVRKRVGRVKDGSGINRAVSRGQERIKLNCGKPKSCVLHTAKTKLRVEVV